MKVLIIGANGQLGSDLMKAMSDWDLIPLTHEDIEICDFVQTRRIITNANPEVVINTAAYHKVDECEEDIKKSFQINTYAVRNLAQICQDLCCILVHLSTDYVFGGEKSTPYTEEDMPNPLNTYGVSKLAGEYFVKNICEKHFIVRTSGLYGVAGSSGKGGNFVETMIKLAKEGKPIRVVNDQRMALTYTVDLARKMVEFIQTEHYGLYHVTNSGDCTWYEFAAKILELVRLSPDLSPTTTEAFGAKARRPEYSVLDHRGLARIGLDDMPSWEQALESYLQERE